MDKVKTSPGCSINIVRPNPLLNSQEALHPGTRACDLFIHFLVSRGSQNLSLIVWGLSSHLRLLSEIQHVGNCPIDCASIYFNGVRRSGLYTVMPSMGGMPVEVYCDMDTDGKRQLMGKGKGNFNTHSRQWCDGPQVSRRLLRES